MRSGWGVQGPESPAQLVLLIHWSWRTELWKQKQRCFWSPGPGTGDSGETQQKYPEEPSKGRGFRCPGWTTLWSNDSFFFFLYRNTEICFCSRSEALFGEGGIKTLGGVIRVFYGVVDSYDSKDGWNTEQGTDCSNHTREPDTWPRASLHQGLRPALRCVSLNRISSSHWSRRGRWGASGVLFSCTINGPVAVSVCQGGHANGLLNYWYSFPKRVNQTVQNGWEGSGPSQMRLTPRPSCGHRKVVAAPQPSLV